MKRYSQLLQIVEQTKPRTIIEIGTWNGQRAVEMLTEAQRHGPCHYYGFDLFEGASEETDSRELNVKAHFGIRDVSKTLEGFDFDLVKGDTRETLPFFMNQLPVSLDRPILAFIDGGHSVETIRSDFEALKGCDYIVLDDYYQPDTEGKCPDVDRYGCNRLLESLGEMGTDWFVLPVSDAVKDGGRVFMATIGFNPPIAITKQLIVKTKNSIPDETICENIAYALSKNLPEFQPCRRHDNRAVIVSGGPTLKDHLAEVRAHDGYVFCVKTSHDWLIANGVIPYGCILLDPRPHVLDFVENPHPEVTYFVASQVHPRALDRLIERNAKIVLYHAAVGAGEEKLLAGKSLVLGGSTSATRGISLLNAAGFCRFDLYGYDSCFQEKPGDDYVVTGDGKKPMQVKVNGQEFWTTAELIAQAQDFDKIARLAIDGNSLDLEVHGDGIIPAIWRGIKPDKADFEATYGNG